MFIKFSTKIDGHVIRFDIHERKHAGGSTLDDLKMLHKIYLHFEAQSKKCPGGQCHLSINNR